MASASNLLLVFVLPLLVGALCKRRLAALAKCEGARGATFCGADCGGVGDREVVLVLREPVDVEATPSRKVLSVRLTFVKSLRGAVT